MNATLNRCKEYIDARCKKYENDTYAIALGGCVVAGAITEAVLYANASNPLYGLVWLLWIFAAVDLYKRGVLK
ncbi:MAG: hypothetical protein WCQ65_11625 [Fermentimonas sp.]